jgi:hypothetical protein
MFGLREEHLERRLHRSEGRRHNLTGTIERSTGRGGMGDNQSMDFCRARVPKRARRRRERGAGRHDIVDQQNPRPHVTRGNERGTRQPRSQRPSGLRAARDPTQ